MKKLIQLGLIMSIAILVTGCFYDPEVSPPEQHPLAQVKPENTTITETFKLSGITSDDAIKESQIDKLVVQRLYDSSQKKAFHTYRVNRYSSGFIYEKKNQGLLITSTDDSYILSYKVGRDSFSKNGDKEKTYAYKKYVINKKYTKDGDKIILTVNYPATYEKVTVANGLNPSYDLKGYENTDQDVLKMFNSFGTGVQVSREIQKEGEINSEYNAGSIYANFERKLGKYDWSSSNNDVELGDLKKENTFALKIGNKTLPVNIAVYPYKNGSKVVYKVFINYHINTSTGPDISMTDINAIHDAIAKIVND